MRKTRIGICGYGNLGRGVESEISKSRDMELVAIFTRRNPESVKDSIKSETKVFSIENIEEYTNEIDVMIMCGGSSTDLPVQVPEISRLYNTVDSFDTHARIPEYFEKVNEVAKKSMKTSLISGGWDPGMFSIMRTYANAILPNGKTYTFWGKGVSQGHSDAIRRIKGVLDARQYTIPIENSIQRVRNGENPELSIREKHTRECFVVAEEGVDTKEIEKEIKEMPNYFSDYDTTVNFITEEELKKNHSKLAHGGFVIHSGITGDGNKEIIEYSLKLDSNPEFTASVLIALARATYKLNQKGEYGAKTILDIPPALMSEKTGEELRKELL